MKLSGIAGVCRPLWDDYSIMFEWNEMVIYGKKSEVRFCEPSLLSREYMCHHREHWRADTRRGSRSSCRGTRLTEPIKVIKKRNKRRIKIVTSVSLYLKYY